MRDVGDSIGGLLRAQASGGSSVAIDALIAHAPTTHQIPFSLLAEKRPRRRNLWVIGAARQSRQDETFQKSESPLSFPGELTFRASLPQPDNLRFGDQLGGKDEVNLWLTVKRAIVFGERGECDFGLPRHVGVALAGAPLKHLNHALACQIEVFVRGTAVREIVTRERVHE